MYRSPYIYFVNSLRAFGIYYFFDC